VILRFLPLLFFTMGSQVFKTQANWECDPRISLPRERAS